MTVIGVLCLVDREQGGRLNIERALAEIPPTPDQDSDAPIPFLSVFTATDVRTAHIALKSSGNKVN
jgi:orotate phosphoribosyltransferase